MKILRNLYGQNLLLHCIYSAIAQYCNTISVAGLKKNCPDDDDDDDDRDCNC